MTVDPRGTPYRTGHRGIVYYFCSAGCQKKFEAEPDRFLAAAIAPSEDVAPGAPPMPAAVAIYTCPMHPEVRRNGPGACPICGMALEPEVAAAEAGPSRERIDMERRLWIAWRWLCRSYTWTWAGIVSSCIG